MAAGFAGGAIVGVSAGSAAAALEEQERRTRERDLKLGRTTPEIEAALSQPEPETPDERGRWQKFKDGCETYFNFKVGAVMGLLGAASGLVMAAAYYALGTSDNAAIVSGMKSLLGAAANNPAAVTAYFTGVMGVGFGGLWTINVPPLATAMQDFAGNLINGKHLGTQWGPAPEKTQAQDLTPTPEMTCEAEDIRRFQNLLAQQKTGAPEQYIYGR